MNLIITETDLQALPILFEDEHYIAIYKPAKLLVHRSPIDKRETEFAVQALRDQVGYPVSPVHRLDKPTSGVLLFAKHSEAVQKAQALFELQLIDKTYLAIVRGYAPQELDIDRPVKARKDKLNTRDQTDKPAHTRLRKLATKSFSVSVDPRYPESRYSLLALAPKTGRRHQLRYHCKHIRHPIIGDSKYGRAEHNRFFEHALEQSRLYLTAATLSFTHPYTKAQLSIAAKPDSEFLRACDWCEFSDTVNDFFNQPPKLFSNMTTHQTNHSKPS